MKKFLAGLLVLFVLMISAPLAAEAHNGCRKHSSAKRYKRSNYRSANRGSYYNNNNYNRGNYSSRGYTTYRRPNFYGRHRNLINLGIGTGGGAIAAFKAAGVDPVPPVTGNDATQAALQLIIAGDQYNTISKPSEIVAAAAAQGQPKQE